MITKSRVLFVPAILLCLGASLAHADIPESSSSETNLETNIERPKPAAHDGKVANVTARMLQSMHYSRKPFDDTVSSNLLFHFQQELDPQHIHFLRSDIEEFRQYEMTLDDLTLKKGDTAPAYQIFNRFIERLEQKNRYVLGLLKNEKFEFNTEERATLNRKDLPYPKDLDEAKKLWRERLLSDYLQEKLNATKPSAQKSAGTDKKEVAKKEKSAEEIQKDIIKTLTGRYTRIFKTFAEWDSGDVLQLYLTTLAHVYDPHSDYMGPAQSENFAITMNLSLFGIGAELVSEDGYCTIRKLVPGPAMKSKNVQPKDRIVGVAQGDAEFVDVVDMPLTKVVGLIRGQKDTTVRLKIIPADASDPAARKVVSLVREEIKLEDQEAKAKIIELPDKKDGSPVRLGVIDLPSFYATFDIAAARGRSEARSTTADVAKLLKKLKEQNVTGIVLDLRRNGGGSLEEAIRLTGLFIEKGPVVQVRDPDGFIMVEEDKDSSVLYDGPLIVLTSRFSASASEIVAGALQDYGRALIVGDSSTHGKGTVQSLSELNRVMRGSFGITNDPGALKVTIKKFYRPSGSSTQLKGVVPDIVLPSVNNVLDVGEISLDNPLPWDTISSAVFAHLNRVESFVETLRRQSEHRIAGNKDFEYIREDIELYKKVRDDKSVSLNEAERLKEKEESQARQQARDQERLARKAAPPKVYEITLKVADQPGLPSPVGITNTVAAAEAGAVHTGDLSSAAPEGAPGESAEAEEDAPKPPAIDATLEETERILRDYIALLSDDNALTVSH